MDNLASEIDNVKEALNISDLTAQVSKREREREIFLSCTMSIFVCIYYIMHGPVNLM